jgi:hypothetical protein
MNGDAMALSQSSQVRRMFGSAIALVSIQDAGC